MTTVNQARAKSTDLHDHLARRPHKHSVRARVRQVRRRIAAQREARRVYDGGLKAEQDAAAAIAKREETAARAELRTLILGRKGRRISLQALLRQSRADGMPRWALVDPDRPISDNNGGYDGDGDVAIVGVDVAGRSWSVYHVPVGHKRGRVKPSGAFPPLPPTVRKLATDRKIRRRAEWIGVLYQPEQWEQIPERAPDPALIVKWRGVDGYFALAVWGGDRAELMEFVD